MKRKWETTGSMRPITIDVVCVSATCSFGVFGLRFSFASFFRLFPWFFSFEVIARSAVDLWISMRSMDSMDFFWSMYHGPIPKKYMEKKTGIVRTDWVCGTLPLSGLPVLSLLSALCTLCSVQQSTAPWHEIVLPDEWRVVLLAHHTLHQVSVIDLLVFGTLEYTQLPHRKVPIFVPRAINPLFAAAAKTEKQKMKKKIEPKWMKDQKKQRNIQKKKRSLRKMKRSSEKQIFEVHCLKVSML